MIYKIISITFLLFSASLVYAQKPITVKLISETSPPPNDAAPPKYGSGENELYKYLETNIKYPPILVKIKMEGSLDLKFKVTEDGSIKDIEITRGFDPDADDEVIRVLNAMPKWTPASVKGNPVDFVQEMTVTFTLTDDLTGQAGQQPKEKAQAAEKDSLPTVIPAETLPQTEKEPVAPVIDDPLNTDPRFPGGKKALEAYLKTNMKYPKRAMEHRIEGRVIFNIEVSAEGEITKIRLFKGVFPDCDEEAFYLIKKMPKWIPGLKDGKPAAKQIMLPVPFKLPK
jgi:TonB family protein